MTASLFGFALVRSDDLRKLQDEVARTAAQTANLDARARDLQVQASEIKLREHELATLAGQLETQSAALTAQSQALHEPEQADLAHDLDARKREAVPLEPPALTVAEGPVLAAAVAEVIRLADGLFDFTGHGAATEELSAAAVVDWTGARARALLDTLDVKPVEDVGPFDPERHHAVDAEPAPTPDLADHIAATVRPGFEWHGKLIQPQLVTIYTE